MFKLSVKILVPTLIFMLFVPFIPTNAASPSYSYRHTKMGSGTRQTGQWEYEITNEKYDFTTNESVFALTRIFKITDVSNFQFKYEIRGASSRDMLSPVYRPNKSWWAEIWYWDEFGKLPSGNYSLGVLISLDNGAFKRVDTKYFSVSGNYVYDNTYEYENVQEDGNCQYPSYNYEWVETGKNIRHLGAHTYEVVNPSNSFKNNENIFVMVKNSHISSTDSFRIKFDVYLDGKYYHRTNEPATLYPNCQLWAYNYTWGNLGTLPNGNHEIRTYIKLNNGSYRLLNTKKINVSSPVSTTVNTVKKPVATSRSYNSSYSFNYSWTQTDNQILYEGDYRYSPINPRDTFYSSEDIMVLTKLSDIGNIDSFRIRHELHKDGSLVKKSESAERKPAGSAWKYNYTETNFGKLSSGNYEIRVFISINGAEWRYLDAKLINIIGGSYVDDVNYNWTLVGNNRDFYNYGYYNINYPSYVTFPFSESQL